MEAIGSYSLLRIGVSNVALEFQVLWFDRRILGKGNIFETR